MKTIPANQVKGRLAHLFFQRDQREIIASCLLSRLLRLQKHATRLFLDADFSQSSVSLFSKLKWRPFSKL